MFIYPAFTPVVPTVTVAQPYPVAMPYAMPYPVGVPAQAPNPAWEQMEQAQTRLSQLNLDTTMTNARVDQLEQRHINQDNHIAATMERVHNHNRGGILKWISGNDNYHNLGSRGAKAAAVAWGATKKVAFAGIAGLAVVGGMSTLGLTLPAFMASAPLIGTALAEAGLVAEAASVATCAAEVGGACATGTGSASAGIATPYGMSPSSSVVATPGGMSPLTIG